MMTAPAQFACPVCGSARHELIDRAGFDLWAGDLHMSSRDPVGQLAVCMDCGRFDFFVNDPAAWVEKIRQPLFRRRKHRDA